jgi:hypothetical protein
VPYCTRSGLSPFFSHSDARRTIALAFINVLVAEELFGLLFSLPNVYSIVAEGGGKPLGSNFLWEGDSIAGIGPLTVESEFQNAAADRQLMRRVLDRATERKCAGMRLVQAG